MFMVFIPNTVRGILSEVLKKMGEKLLVYKKKGL